MSVRMPKRLHPGSMFVNEGFRVYSWCCLLLTTIISSNQHRGAGAQQFNYEVEKRINDRLEFFLGNAASSTQVISNFRSNFGFEHNLQVMDRDEYLKLAFSVSEPLSYYAMEDGSFAGYYVAHGYYREPGNAGYLLDDPLMSMQVKTCVNKEGGDVPCLLQTGDRYVVCRGNNETRPGLCGELEVCEGQPDCSALDDEAQQAECLSQQKWCRQYTLDVVKEEDPPRGHLPLTSLCIDPHGRFTNEGLVLNPRGSTREPTPDNLVPCTYDNGKPVTTRVNGKFSYCNGEVCNGAFAGLYGAFEYDARYRPWYTAARKNQGPLWSAPYVFVPNLMIGVTYTEPLYESDENGRQIFSGTLVVDVRLEDISNFLVDSYKDTDTSVLIYEDEEPHYIIASSTGSEPARLVRSDDLESDCPDSFDYSDDSCTSIRVPLTNPGPHRMDKLLMRAAFVHMEADYPEDLLSVKSSDDEFSLVYVSQSTLFDGQPGILWRVLVVSPAAVSESDAITAGNPLLVVICIVSGMGFAACMFFLAFMYRERSQRTVVYLDWRFSCVFIFCCSLLNLSNLVLLGENTNRTCLARMWTFHLFLTMALAPLLVKVWRINQLVGGGPHRRITITNHRTVLYTLPIILSQVLIILLTTILDPPVATERIEVLDGIITQRVLCDQKTNAFFIAELVFDSIIIFSGCVLAYMTRGLAEDFGEAKQLIFSMYNIALAGLIFVVITQSTSLENNSVVLLQTVGVFWGTVFSTAAFVVPAFLKVKQKRNMPPENDRIRVSGINSEPLGSRLRISKLDLESEAFGSKRHHSEPLVNELFTLKVDLESETFAKTHDSKETSDTPTEPKENGFPVEIEKPENL